MAVTADQFRDDFPEFAGRKDREIDVFLARGLRLVSSTPDGPLRDDAIAYAAAHMMSIDPFAEDARMEPEGGDPGLSSTVYGRRFMALRRLLSPTVMVV